MVDFEFGAPPGYQQDPICVVAMEFATGQTVRLWQDELKSLKQAPYPCDKNSLFVAFFATAELGCHLSLGWGLPVYILDLYVEFRNLTNGKPTPCGDGLLGALAYFGISGVGSAEKDEMRDLAIRGGPWTQQERTDLLAYCETDVVALAKLLPKILGYG